MQAARGAVQTVLLVEDDPEIAALILSSLAGSRHGRFELERVKQVSEALDRLRSSGIAAVLLNPFLPDSSGMDTVKKLLLAAPTTPLLILGDEEHELFAVEAVECGAQDYLLPSHLDSYSLERALRNAIERKIVEDALYVERDRALITLNSIGDAVLCTDIQGHITFLNPVAERMTGWTREEAAGRPHSEVFQVIDVTTRKKATDPVKMVLKQNRQAGLASDSILVRRDGGESAIEDSVAPIHDRAGNVTGAVVVFHDVSAARAMTIKMTHSAHHDAVTELPNRVLLNDRIGQTIASARRYHRTFALMFVDLDHFKSINDSLGHAVGDKLLQAVAKRLAATLRDSDTVGRYGGDEFVVLLPEIGGEEDVRTSAAKLLLALSKPYVIDGTVTLHVTGSIGISAYPEDGRDAETLLQHADLAMYAAKESGRNQLRFFQSEMKSRAVDRKALEVGLRLALEQNELLLHYQPKVNLKTGKVTGAEALLRWHKPDLGMIAPTEFIQIAEDCGLIVTIGGWVLREVCKQLRSWQDSGIVLPVISVNISATEFQNADFIREVRMVLSETGVDARCLQFELTERILMKDALSVMTILKDLKRMGVHLAVDDFGTGYSNLSYLDRFDIDVLKIDRSFMSRITENPEDSVLIGAIIAMGKSLKYLVVAEGVETEEQKAYLMTQGCDEGQGFLFSQPVPPAAFVHLLPRDF